MLQRMFKREKKNRVQTEESYRIFSSWDTSCLGSHTAQWLAGWLVREEWWVTGMLVMLYWWNTFEIISSILVLFFYIFIYFSLFNFFNVISHTVYVTQGTGLAKTDLGYFLLSLAEIFTYNRDQYTLFISVVPWKVSSF